MELKKKTIIWEDDNEPPKNYIWVKSDGNAYEFNHTTRQWEKIMSSNVSDSVSNSDIFFVPATIQPKYFMNESDTEPIEIKNYTLGYSLFLYNKEDIISLGVNKEDLNNLNILGIEDIFDDADNNSYINGLLIPKENFDNKVILWGINPGEKASLYGMSDCYVYKISDNIFIILEGPKEITPVPGVGPSDPVL